MSTNGVMEQEKRKDRFRKTAFMTGVAGSSILFGFGLTIVMAKKKDPRAFTEGLLGVRGSSDSGGALALRALGWGTLYAISGVGLFSWGIWKLMGVHSMEEFSAKMRAGMPRVPKHEPQGKSDFKDVEELVNYIINDGGKSNASKKT